MEYPSPLYLIDYLKLNLIPFGVIQLYVCGSFIVGINLKNLLIGSIGKIIKNGMFLTAPFFNLSLWALVYLPQHLYSVMGSVLLFCLSTGLVFIHYIVKRLRCQTTMGGIIAVFSSTMHIFGFLGKLSS